MNGKSYGMTGVATGRVMMSDKQARSIQLARSKNEPRYINEFLKIPTSVIKQTLDEKTSTTLP